MSNSGANQGGLASSILAQIMGSNKALSGAGLNNLGAMGGKKF